MDDGLKQRLLGAIVLLALAAIFVPVLSDRDPMKPVDRRTQIPPAPHVVPVTISEPVESVNSDPAPEPEEMFIPDDSQPATLSPEERGLDEQGVPKSWVLQVASYRNKDHATQMKDKLTDSGFNAYTRKLQTDQGEMTRVYVGPKLDKRVLLRDKEAIESSYGITTLLLEFDP